MPSRPYPFLPECYYHVYNRGNNRAAIFFEPENYIYFLKGIRQYLLPAADLIAYCLMPTHYHLMIRVKSTLGDLKEDAQVSDNLSKPSEVSRQDLSPVSSAMMRLSLSYTKAINKRFGRSGVIFQGPFKAKPITDSSYLLQLCAYIHANPVKDGLVADACNWPYSNYLEWLGERSGTLVDREFIRAQFPEPGEYRELVANYIRTRNISEPVLQYLDTLES